MHGHTSHLPLVPLIQGSEAKVAASHEPVVVLPAQASPLVATHTHTHTHTHTDSLTLSRSMCAYWLPILLQAHHAVPSKFTSRNTLHPCACHTAICRHVVGVLLIAVLYIAWYQCSSLLLQVMVARDPAPPTSATSMSVPHPLLVLQVAGVLAGLWQLLMWYSGRGTANAHLLYRLNWCPRRSAGNPCSLPWHMSYSGVRRTTVAYTHHAI
jgi:hypothetical protein